MNKPVSTTPLAAATSDRSLDLRQTLTGILPPVAMPFDARGNIIYPAMREQIDLMVDRGVRGVVVGGSTGEGHTLDRDEFGRVLHG